MRQLTTSRRLLAVLLTGGLTLLAISCGDDGATTSNPDTGTQPDDGSGSGNDDGPRDRSDELIGRWEIHTFQLAGGVGLADVVGSEPAFVEFDADGTIRFGNGCNTGDGEWEAFGAYLEPEDGNEPRAGQSLDIGPLSRTEIGCPEELFDQDLAIGGALRAARNFTIGADGSLSIWNQNLMIGATN